MAIQQSAIGNHMEECSKTQIIDLYYGQGPSNKYSKVIKGSHRLNFVICPQQPGQIMKFSVLKQPKNIIETTRLTEKY